MRALSKKIIKDITHRKLRTLLTILGITIGIIGLSAISIASSQFRSSFAYSTDQSAQPDMAFYTLPTHVDMGPSLLAIPNVKAVQPQGDINTRWLLDSGHFPIRIIGVIDFQQVQINQFQLIEGSLPGPNQIVLESSDRAINSVHVGDQIQVEVLGQTRKLTVSGFVRTQGLAAASLVQRAQGYMAENDLETLFQSNGVTSFLVRLNNYAQLDETSKQVAQAFHTQNVQVTGADIGRNQEVSQIADGLFSTMDVLSAIAILLSICLLLGSVAALITEQIQHIGTMKAIGAKRGQVMRHYLTLVTAYGAIGTIIGTALGIFGGYALANYLGSLVSIDIGPLQVSWLLIIECVLVGIGTPLLAAAFPVFLGTRITVRQALMGYGVESGATHNGGAWARMTGGIFGLFPQTVQLGTRGLFRKRIRTILTLITLTVAGAAFLAVQTTSYSFDVLLNQVFDTYHYDVVVSTANPEHYSRFQQILSTVPGVANTERLSRDTVKTQWGDAVLTGVQLDTRLYQKQLTAGRWFTSDDQNAVIISKDAADKSGLKVGDSISFHATVNSATWHIIGIATDYNGMGIGNLGVILAPISQTNAFDLLPADFTQSVMIQSTDTTQAQVDALATRVDDAFSKAGLLPDVTTAQQEIQQNHSKYQIVYILLDLVAVIVALVGAISLSNTLAMSVLERRREIGILRSMGATSRKVAQVFWSEGISLGVLSWLLAMMVGIPAAYGFVLLQGKLLAPIPFAFNPINLAWMLALIILIASLASIGPVFGAARVRIVTTLRYE